MTIDTGGGLTENIIACIEALGGSRPASKGLSELYQALATALSTITPYPLSPPQSGDITGATLVANTLTPLAVSSTITQGLWLVTYGVTLTLVNTSSTPKISLAASTGGGFLGQTTAQFQGTAVSTSLHLACFADPGTGGGTVTFNIQSAQADTVIGPTAGVSPSGYTLTRVD